MAQRLSNAIGLVILASLLVLLSGAAGEPLTPPDHSSMQEDILVSQLDQ